MRYPPVSNPVFQPPNVSAVPGETWKNKNPALQRGFLLPKYFGSARLRRGRYDARRVELRESEVRQQSFLHRVRRSVHRIGARRLTDDHTRRPCTARLLDEAKNRFGDIVRVRRILAVELRCESVDDLLADLASFAVSVDERGIHRPLRAVENVGRIRARLHEHDIDALLR